MKVSGDAIKREVIKSRRERYIVRDGNGAEGETRTLAPVTRPTPLAGAPRHQLEYFCKCNVLMLLCLKSLINMAINMAERKGFDRFCRQNPFVRRPKFKISVPASRSSLKTVRRTVFLRSDPHGFKSLNKIIVNKYGGEEGIRQILQAKSFRSATEI